MPFGELAGRLRAAGLNLAGTVAAAEFDASQPPGRRVAERRPDCGVVVVAGSGGSGFWQVMRRADGLPLRAPNPRYHPVQERGAAIAEDVRAWLALRGVQATVVYPEAPKPLSFVQLAEMAGLGCVSPVTGWLLHPEFGPWVSFRFALLVAGSPFGEVPRAVDAGFQPCAGCSRPCVAACPVQACDEHGRWQLRRCAEHRHFDHGCGDGCELRRACPRGADHRYVAEEEAFRHAYSLFELRRHFGLGWLQAVARWLRPR